jgi:hypothetical protein
MEKMDLTMERGNHSNLPENQGFDRQFCLANSIDNRKRIEELNIKWWSHLSACK